MPIYEYRCPDCDNVYEAIQLGGARTPACPFCDSARGEKLISASSGLTGRASGGGLPGPADHGCCGQRLGQSSCVPGSCCGKAG